MTTATVPMDPRMRARRAAVLRAEGRRRLKLLIGTIALVATVAAAWGLTRSPVLDIDRLQIEGVDGPASDLVEQAAGVVVGVPLLDVDTGAVEARLERLPWVRDVEVSRKWPATLTIEVKERTPVAVVPSGTGFALVDEHGHVIARDGAGAPSIEGLPVIDAPLSVAVGDVHLAAAPGLAVVAALTADLEPWVEAVSVTGESVGLDLVGGAIVNMGPAVRLDDKVVAVRAVLAGVDLSCLSEIDVTVADQTTIERDSFCESLVPTMTDG